MNELDYKASVIAHLAGLQGGGKKSNESLDTANDALSKVNSNLEELIKIGSSVLSWLETIANKQDEELTELKSIENLIDATRTTIVESVATLESDIRTAQTSIQTDIQTAESTITAGISTIGDNTSNKLDTINTAIENGVVNIINAIKDATT